MGKLKKYNTSSWFAFFAVIFLSNLLFSQDISSLKKKDKIVSCKFALFNALNAEGSGNKSLTKYENEYRKKIDSFRKFQKLSTAKLQQKLDSAKIVLLSDVHSLRKSQDFSIEIIQRMLHSHEPLNIVIEWAPRSGQRFINSYLNGKISLSELKELIRFEDNWMVGWESYKRILQIAKRHQIKVWATEMDSRTSSAIADNRVVKQVKEIASQSPKEKVLVIFGTYHLLGKKHLYEKLQENGMKPDLTITETADKIHWNALEKYKNFKFLQIKDDIVLVNLLNPYELKQHQWLFYQEIFEFSEWDI